MVVFMRPYYHIYGKGVPPGASKGKDTRYIDIREGGKLDEAQMATWVRQAAALPGWVP